MKKNIIVGIIIFFVLIVTYLNINDNKENNEIVKNATIVGEEFFEEYYDIKVVFTEHEIMGGYTGSTIDLNGHVKDDPSEKVSILINYRDYSVVTELVSEELYRKRVPGKD